MQAAHAASASDMMIAETEIVRLVGKTLSEAIRHPNRIYGIEGPEGIGKTTAAKTWCHKNPGVARYVSLVGLTSKTAILQVIAQALGIGAIYSRTATDLRVRVEDILQRSKLMLVIDEARYLFTQGERMYSRPEMLDWIYTALTNFEVPCVLLCTSLFAERMRLAEKQNHLELAPVSAPAQIPTSTATSKADLLEVAAKLMPECGKREAKCAVEYASATKWPLTSVVGLVEDARDLAECEGRKELQFTDLERSIKESRVPSDCAQDKAFETTETKPARTSCKSVERSFQRGCNSP